MAGPYETNPNYYPQHPTDQPQSNSYYDNHPQQHGQVNYPPYQSGDTSAYPNHDPNANQQQA